MASAATRSSRRGSQRVRRRQFPGPFDDSAHARDWLPLDWHPDHFDVEEANAALAVATAERAVVTGELTELADQLERRGILRLREVLGRPLSHAPTALTDAEAVRLTEPYRVLLEVIGDGVALTGRATCSRQSSRSSPVAAASPTGGSARPTART